MTKRSTLRLVVAALAAASAAALVVSSVLGKAPSAAVDEIGSRTVRGMTIEAELEDEAEEMQMLMKGKWTIMEPEPGETHHFEVALVDPKFGGHIPYANVSATFVNVETGGKFSRHLDPMYGKDLHYGANLELASGSYRVTVRVKPPTLMRVGEGLNRWLKPVTVDFRFTVSEG